MNTADILRAHELYGQLTGQRLSLGFDRERMWFELLRTGITLDDLARVIGYLQREIREGRRNVGALKLSNLLQPDRFEEDLAISRIKLQAPEVRKPTPTPVPGPATDQEEQARQRALQILRDFKRSLR
jgi:hypothetical protein